MARRRYPNATVVENRPGGFDAALIQTQQALSNPDVSCLCDCVFVASEIRTRIDILEKTPNGKWHAILVKASSKVKPSYLIEMELKRWILEESGLPVERLSVLVLNRNYVHTGDDHDIDSLFGLHDITERTRNDPAAVTAQLAQFRSIETETEPDIAMGNHCLRPYPCDYQSHCQKSEMQTLNPLHHLPGLDRKARQALEEKNILDIREIPATEPLTPLQARVIHSVRNAQETCGPDLPAALSNITYPVHHIDFESFMTAIPLYAGTRPFESIPFQWSNHIEHKDGSITHESYLCTTVDDPRQEFARTLLQSVGTKGSLCIYSNYENTAITGLAQVLPNLSTALLALVDRTWDLMRVIRNHYYHPDFQGSFSVKNVLPVLVPELGYKALAIADGHTAMNEYLRSRTLDDLTERKQIHQNLLDYCAIDTLAMVRIRHALQERCTKN